MSNNVSAGLVATWSGCSLVFHAIRQIQAALFLCKCTHINLSELHRHVGVYELEKWYCFNTSLIHRKSGVYLGQVGKVA